jgi:hypothetical protein
MMNPTTPVTLLEVNYTEVFPSITNATDTSQNNSDNQHVVYGDGTELDYADEQVLSVYHVYDILFMYVAPVIIFSGTSGNILSLVVLQSKYFRRAPSTFILSALALTDTGVLLCGLMRHWISSLTAYEIDIRALTQGTCWVHYFFTYYLPQLSSWSLALLTLERMSSVKWPFKAKVLFSKRRMMILWSITAICLAAVNAQCFKTLVLVQEEYMDGNETIQYNVCADAEDTLIFMLYVWPWLDLFLNSIGPLVIIVTCNVIIIAMLYKMKKLRQGQMQVTTEDESNSITAMLVGISVMFFFSTTPVSIYFIGVHYWPQETHAQNFNTFTAYATLNMLYYLSNSTNFLVYCLSGSKFRRALIAILLCREIEKPVSTAGTKYVTNMSSINGTKADVSPEHHVTSVA